LLGLHPKPTTSGQLGQKSGALRLLVASFRYRSNPCFYGAFAPISRPRTYSITPMAQANKDAATSGHVGQKSRRPIPKKAGREPCGPRL